MTQAACNEMRQRSLVFAVLLLGYATVGGAVGAGWLIWLVFCFVSGPAPTPPYVTVFSVNLLFAPIAMVGGLLALNWYRSADSAEQATVALRRLHRWVGITAGVVIAFVASMGIAAVVTGEWPG